MGKWMLLALLAPGLAVAGDLSTQSNSELCVRRVTALIANQPVFGSTEPEISAELQRRGEACADTALYIEVAERRIADSQRAVEAQMQAADQQQQAQRLAEEERREERSERIRAAGRAYLQSQQKPAPVTTTCQQTVIGVTCTSR